jgi:hypothetical protein
MACLRNRNNFFGVFCGVLNPKAHAKHKDFDKFFVWGRAVKSLEPVDPGLIARVKQEITHLLNLPGVREASDQVERRFRETLAEYDRQLGLRGLYESYRTVESRFEGE